MNTRFLLLAQYELAVIPLDVVARDYFKLTTEKLARKCLAGEIDLPITRMGDSQKAAKGVALADLAAYLDKRMAAARKECDQLRPVALIAARDEVRA
jgi:Pyocin activator protein PrtN